MRKAKFRIQNSEFRMASLLRFCIQHSEFCICMLWNNVKLIFLREVRDQLRDRRTLFTVLVLPLLLYPLMGALVFQVQQFLKEHPSKVRLVGTAALPEQPALIKDEKLAEKFGDNSLLSLEIVPNTKLTFDELQNQARDDIRLGICDA